MIDKFIAERNKGITKLTNKIKHINNKKSANLDLIPNIAIKNLPREIIKQLAILFNNALNWSYFLNSWKKAKVTPKKKKDKDSHVIKNCAN